jgi:hypothetical protein
VEGYFEEERAMNRWTWLIAILMLAALLLMGAYGAQSAVEAQEAVPTRPPFEPTPPSGPAVSPESLPPLRGSVQNWGLGGLAGAQVILQGDDWTLETTTNAAGDYHFDHVPDGVVLLNAVPPQESGLQPLTQDVAVSIQEPYARVVSLGMYGEEAPQPAARLEVRADERIAQGQQFRLTMIATNDWPIDISQVMITHLLTDCVSFVGGEATKGRVYATGSLVVADVEGLLVGETVTATVMLEVDKAAPVGTEFVHRTSLIYGQNVAVQDEGQFTVTPGVTDVLPVTGMETMLPVVGGVALIALLIGVRRLRQRVA